MDKKYVTLIIHTIDREIQAVLDLSLNAEERVKIDLDHLIFDTAVLSGNYDSVDRFKKENPKYVAELHNKLIRSYNHSILRALQRLDELERLTGIYFPTIKHS